MTLTVETHASNALWAAVKHAQNLDYHDDLEEMADLFMPDDGLNPYDIVDACFDIGARYMAEVGIAGESDTKIFQVDTGSVRFYFLGVEQALVDAIYALGKAQSGE